MNPTFCLNPKMNHHPITKKKKKKAVFPQCKPTKAL